MRGELSRETNWKLAQKAFATTAAYDSAIASTLGQISHDGSRAAGGLPRQCCASATRKSMDLRYGENPHQKAALYADSSNAGIAHGRQLQGKELCYNNLVDLQACWDLAQEFDKPAVAIIKHTNPAARRPPTSSQRPTARRSRPIPFRPSAASSASIVAIDGETADEMAKLFVEAIVAPGFD